MAGKKPHGKEKVGQTLRNILIVLALFIILVDILDLLGIISARELFQGKQSTADISRVDVTVSFIDVGQGDCTLINACGRHILIDAGERDQGQRVVDYLRDAGVDRLDMAVVTHPHSDHIGGMINVIKEIGADEILMPRIPDELTPTSSTYEKFLKTVAESGTKLTPAKAGDEYRFGDAYLKLLSPQTDSVYDNLNDYSVVTRLTFEDTSFLFMGDAEAPVEKELRNLGEATHVNLLKVGHHGSSSSSTKKFLEEVSPDYAVILCGVDNSYNHPNDKIVERLEKNARTILRTDLDGTIVFESDGKTLSYTTEKKPETITDADT